MKNETSHDILRSSILFEMHGEKLYREVAAKAQNQEVRNFFEQMAKDESMHADALRKLFESYQNASKFDTTTHTWFTTNRVEQIRNPMLVELIQTSSFEAAAVTAAILMEEKSVIEYTAMAKNSTDKEEKKLYQWLAAWEQEHVERLSILRDGIKVKTLITERLETF